MRYLMFLNDPQIAQYVCQQPDIVPFVDLEVMGKAERQGHLTTWKSSQTAADVTRIREAVPDAHLVVRINPLHDDSKAEIDDVIARGANSVMLPMFFDAQAIGTFLDLLAGRATPLPLFETAASVAALPEIITQFDLTQLHIGLNDLHLDLGLDFLFQPLAEGMLEAPAAAMRARGVAFGIGGLARAREGIVSPQYLLGEHVRLGSTATILSQTFHRNPTNLADLKASMDFPAELAQLREIYTDFRNKNTEALARNQQETRDRVADVVALIRARKDTT